MFRNIFLVLNNRFFAYAILSEHIVNLTIIHIIKQIFIVEKINFKKHPLFVDFLNIINIFALTNTCCINYNNTVNYGKLQNY